MNPEHLTPEEASERAAHKAKSAQMAVEIAREIQLAEAIEKSSTLVAERVFLGLKEIFGDGDQNSPTQMKVLVQRIPILCTDIAKMHDAIADTKNDVADIKDNLKWGVRLVIGAVIMALLGMVLIP